MASVETSTVRVFLVEDSLHMQTALKDLFETLGHFEVLATVATETQATAWLQAHEGEWHIAVVDLMLDEGTGFNLVRRCHSQPDAGTIIVLSDFVTPAVEKRCLQQGADAVFKKNDATAFANYVAALGERLRGAES
jgi:DNA-binding NarL/FixJ family response regulator